MIKKICVITGATSGIGYETAKSLTIAGFKVIIACRNDTKAQKAIKGILEAVPDGDISNIPLDLSSFASIENFAEQFYKNYSHLDVLINNAATICDRPHKTQEGFNLTIGVNYIGLYYLTELLLSAILSTSESRIINVSSIVGHKSRMEDEIYRFKDDMYGIRAYTASKLAVILYTIDLAKRLKGKVTVNALHPGVIGSNIWTGEGFFMKITKPFMKLIFPSPIHGAKHILYLAVSDDVKSISGAMFVKSKAVKHKYSSTNNELRKNLISATKKAVEEAKNAKKIQ